MTEAPKTFSKPRIGLKVWPIPGEHGLRYHVESRSHPQHPRMVDLAAHGGWCQCSCENWNCTVWPRVRDRVGHKHTRETTCVHVRAALHFFLELALRAWIKNFSAYDPPDCSP